MYLSILGVNLGFTVFYKFNLLLSLELNTFGKVSAEVSAEVSAGVSAGFLREVSAGGFCSALPHTSRTTLLLQKQLGRNLGRNLCRNVSAEFLRYVFGRNVFLTITVSRRT